MMTIIIELKPFSLYLPGQLLYNTATEDHIIALLSNYIDT